MANLEFQGGLDGGLKTLMYLMNRLQIDRNPPKNQYAVVPSLPSMKSDAFKG